MALSLVPACLPLPRAGAPAPVPLANPERSVARGLGAFPQRRPAEAALALGAAGFPGLTLDGERATVSRTTAERAIDRLTLAYLRGERAAGMPPAEQLAASNEQLRAAEQPRVELFKVELLGPVSLALQATDEDERPLAYDGALRETLAQHVALRAEWLREAIAATGLSALVALDEPFLDALGTPFCPLGWEEGGDLLARTLDDIGRPRGLCVAGTPGWEQLLTLPAEVIFFDAYEHSAELLRAARAVVAFLERGGALAWGIVPSEAAALAQERAETLARRLISGLEFLADAGGCSPDQVAARALVSTAASLAQLPSPQAERAVALCGEVSAVARAYFGLE